MTDEPVYEGILLGRDTPGADEYAPQLLYSIPRADSRARQGIGDNIFGVDLWHAYEMSWLERQGKPTVRVGRFSIPASSSHMVESKSFKLYLNSLNNMTFDDEAGAAATITDDISRAVGEAVSLELLHPNDSALVGIVLTGDCLDALDVAPVSGAQPSSQMLQLHNGGDIVEETLYSHLLRSLCPVTGQPDWATVWVHYRGRALERKTLLQYIIAYRQHQEFHEQCVERMFGDITSCCEAEFLHIQGFYTRRGGLDISPFRSTDPTARPLTRLNRQ